jgi:superfamily I DNA/RNA helicase
MVTSLTKAGAREAASRIELPPQQVGTVHSFAYRALGSPELAESQVKEWNAAHPEFELSSHSSTADDVYGVHDEGTVGDALKLEVARLRTLGRDPMYAPLSDIGEFFAAWEDWMKQCGLMDFVDLIDTALRDVEKAPGEPAVILNDEQQDTGLAEMRLLMKWAKYAEHLVLAGDHQQCHPPGTMILTTQGEVSIEELCTEKHKLISFDRHGSYIVGIKYGGYSFKKRSFFIENRLVRVRLVI